MMKNIFNLKPGDTIIVENGYCLSAGVYLGPKGDDGIYYYEVSWRFDTLFEVDNNPNPSDHWIPKRLKAFKSGTSKPWKSYIQNRADSRVFPITEEKLPQIAKDFIKFYKSYINNEYKNDRSKYSI